MMDAPAERKSLAVFGGILFVLGVMCLASGKIPQDPDSGGPPLEDSLARFGGVVMIVFGAVILIWFLNTRSNHTKRDDHE